MLQCETNTTEVMESILAEAWDTLDRRPGELRAVFEHGQWWVTDPTTGGQWAVCDCEGLNGETFDFEQVTPDEE